MKQNNGFFFRPPLDTEMKILNENSDSFATVPNRIEKPLPIGSFIYNETEIFKEPYDNKLFPELTERSRLEMNSLKSRLGN